MLAFSIIRSLLRTLLFYITLSSKKFLSISLWRKLCPSDQVFSAYRPCEFGNRLGFSVDIIVRKLSQICDSSPYQICIFIILISGLNLLLFLIWFHFYFISIFYMFLYIFLYLFDFKKCQMGDMFLFKKLINLFIFMMALVNKIW